ncbi:MAG: shikimate kinase [Clostridiales bacterium]|nr:shikimate kinase [Clostridiales bacterium]
MDRHIFLIGMPGSGKSSLGKRVARRNRIPYIDCDQLLSQKAKMSIYEVFQKYGELAFRNSETNLLIHLCDEAPSIISTGGGMVMRKTNQEIMKNAGLIVLVDRPIEQILSDIKLDRRPMLEKTGMQGVVDLYKERMPLYRSLADVILDNGKGFHPGVAELEKILKKEREKTVVANV